MAGLPGGAKGGVTVVTHHKLTPTWTVTLLYCYQVGKCVGRSFCLVFILNGNTIKVCIM